ncbi:MAG: hypothetical protein E7564_02855 [Ruminococcaceae bacterium]|nr:hypothetical protein [Oscillospiraceae bacterium]
MKKFVKKLTTVKVSLKSLLKKNLIFTKYKSYKDEPLLLSAALVADLHADGDRYRDRNNKLRYAFASISNAKRKLDALILAGDITNSGHISEYSHVKRFMKKYLNVMSIIPQLGNHDARSCSIYPYFDEATELFDDFCKFCKQEKEKDKNYYYTVVNNCYVIMLATDKLPDDGAFISCEQLEWFENVLTEAEKSQKPIIVVNHQPPLLRNKAKEVFLYDAGERVEEVMLKHSNSDTPIIYISGHMHRMGENTYEKVENIHYINLPALQYGPNEKEEGAYGFLLEIYNKFIVLRARDFEKNKWIDEYLYEIPWVNNMTRRKNFKEKF